MFVLSCLVVAAAFAVLLSTQSLPPLRLPRDRPGAIAAALRAVGLSSWAVGCAVGAFGFVAMGGGLACGCRGFACCKGTHFCAHGKQKCRFSTLFCLPGICCPACRLLRFGPVASASGSLPAWARGSYEYGKRRRQPQCCRRLFPYSQLPRAHAGRLPQGPYCGATRAVRHCNTAGAARPWHESQGACLAQAQETLPLRPACTSRRQGQERRRLNKTT